MKNSDSEKRSRAKAALRLAKAQSETTSGHMIGQRWTSQEDLEVLTIHTLDEAVKIGRVLGRTAFGCLKRASNLRSSGFTRESAMKSTVVTKVMTRPFGPIVVEYVGTCDTLGNTYVCRYMSDGTSQKFLVPHDRCSWGTKTESSYRLGWKLLFDVLRRFFPTLVGEGRHRFMVWAAPRFTDTKIRSLTHMFPFGLPSADLVTWVSDKLNEYSVHAA